jgi:hypothetical protein
VVVFIRQRPAANKCSQFGGCTGTIINPRSCSPPSPTTAASDAAAAEQQQRRLLQHCPVPGQAELARADTRNEHRQFGTTANSCWIWNSKTTAAVVAAEAATHESTSHQGTGLEGANHQKAHEQSTDHQGACNEGTNHESTRNGRTDHQSTSNGCARNESTSDSASNCLTKQGPVHGGTQYWNAHRTANLLPFLGRTHPRTGICPSYCDSSNNGGTIGNTVVIAVGRYHDSNSNHSQTHGRGQRQ